MSKSDWRFKESDLMRAIKVAIKAGLKVATFEITKSGNIRVHTDPRASEIGTKREERDTWADL